MSGLSEVFWIFIIITALQPIIKQKLLDASRLRLITRFEKQRGSRTIALVHRQETMAFLGFPLMKYIDVNDSEEVLRAIKLTDPSVPIDLIVHTPGGLVLAAAQIANALKRHPGKVTVFVPHYAMSGGTLIALAADEIVMDPNAVLGPVDPQLGQSPAASIMTVLERKNVNDIDDQTLILADVAPQGARPGGGDCARPSRRANARRSGRGPRQETRVGDVDARLRHHQRGGQVARPAHFHGHAARGLRFHAPVRAAHPDATVGRNTVPVPHRSNYTDHQAEAPRR